MYCTNCGTQMEDGTKVCPTCGKSNEKVIAKSQKGKARFGSLKITKGQFIGIVVAVVVIVVVVASWGSLSHFFAKNFMSAGKYYAYIEKDNIETTVSMLYNVYDSVNYGKDAKQGSTGVLRVELGDKMKDIYELINAEDYIDWLENVELVIDTDTAPDYQSIGFVGKLNDTSIASGSLIVDNKNSSVYASLSEILEKTLKIEFEKEDFEENISSVTEEMTFVMERLQKIIPSEKVAEELLVKYFDIIVKSIDNIKKEKDNLKVEDITQSCTLITAKIDGDAIINVLVTVLEEAKDDSEIKKIVFDLAEIDDEDPKDYYEEFVSSLEDFIDEVEDTDSEDLDDYLGSDIVLKTWVNGNGEIIGREIRLNDGSVIEAISVEKGSNVATKVAVKSLGKKILEFSGTGKKSGKNKLNGEYTLEVYGDEYVKLEVKNFDTNAYEKHGNLNGEFYLALGEDLDIDDMIDADDLGLNITSLLDDLKIGIIVSSSEKKASLSVALLKDEEAYVTLKVSSELRDYKKPSIPKDKNCEVIDSDDMYAMEDVMESADFEKIIENLEDAGVAEALIDYLTYYLMYGGF